MKHFRYVPDLPVVDLLEELLILQELRKINWKDVSSKEICLQGTTPNSDDIFEGAGSLNVDWANSKLVTLDGGFQKRVAEPIKNPKREEDFKYLCKPFQGTLFEEVYDELNKRYNLGRIKLFRSSKSTCLSWHADKCDRIHYPMKTQDGCFMTIGDEILHLRQNEWYWAETTVPHTAFNASYEDRIHLVVGVFDPPSVFKDYESPEWDQEQARRIPSFSLPPGSQVQS